MGAALCACQGDSAPLHVVNPSVSCISSPPPFPQTTPHRSPVDLSTTREGQLSFQPVITPLASQHDEPMHPSSDIAAAEERCRHDEDEDERTEESSLMTDGTELSMNLAQQQQEGAVKWKPRPCNALMFGLAIPTMLSNSAAGIAAPPAGRNGTEGGAPSPVTPHRTGASSDNSKSFDASAAIPPIGFGRSSSNSMLLRGGGGRPPPVVIRVLPTLSTSECGNDASAPKLYVFRQQSSHLFSNGAYGDYSEMSAASESCDEGLGGAVEEREGALHALQPKHSDAGSSGGWGGDGEVDHRKSFGSGSDTANAPCVLFSTNNRACDEGDPLTPLVRCPPGAAASSTKRCDDAPHHGAGIDKLQQRALADKTLKAPTTVVGFVELAKFASLQ